MSRERRTKRRKARRLRGCKTNKETALATWPSEGAKQVTSLETLV